MPSVFISHSSLDREIVEREIISPLRTHGVDTWYSTDDIETTSEWERQIRNGLTKCDWFLVVLSPRSVESEWVMREVHWAVMKRKGKIVPVMLETCEPEELHLGLLPIQYIDFRDRGERSLERLLATWGLDKASQAKSMYGAAQDLIEKEDWTSAVEKLEAVLRLDPTHSQSRTDLEHVRRQEYLASTYEDGVTALREKRWGEALKMLRQLRNVDGAYKNIEELIALAGAELEKEEAERLFNEALKAAGQHEWAKAVELFQAVLKMTPSHALAQSELAKALQQKELAELYAKGREHTEAGRWSEALKMFRRVRSIDRGYKGVSELIADADARLAEEEEQRSKKEAAEREKRQRAELQLRQVQNGMAVEVRRGSDKVSGERAASRLSARKIGLVTRRVLLATLKTCVVIIGLLIVIWLSIYVVQRIQASRHNSQGDELFAQQKYAEAELVYRKAVEKSPNDADHRNDLGSAFAAQRKHGEAEVEYRKATELSPGNAWHHDRLGNALREQKKYAEAEAECREAVKLQPDISGYHNNLAGVLHEQRKYVEAETEFRKAVELNSSDAMYHNNLGLTLSSQKKYAEAEAEFRRAIELNANHPRYPHDLGESLYAQGKFKEAETAFRKAIELNPHNAGYQCNLGLSLRYQGRVEEATAAYRKALEIDPNYEWAKRALLQFKYGLSRLGSHLGDTSYDVACYEDETSKYCMYRVPDLVICRSHRT